MSTATFDITLWTGGAFLLLSSGLWLMSHSRTEEGFRNWYRFGGIISSFAGLGLGVVAGALFVRLGIPDYRDGVLGLSPGRYVTRASGAEFSVVARTNDDSPELCVRIPGPLPPTFTVPLRAPMRAHEARAGF